MEKTTVYNNGRMRHRMVILGIALVMLVMAIPVNADVISVDPEATPEVSLPPDEALRLLNLQGVSFPKLLSPFSPNGKYILTNLPDVGVAFYNVRNGKKTAVNQKIYDLKKVTEYRWINNRILTYVGMDENDAFHMVRLNRRSGSLTTVPQELPGYPFSLSNRADKVLLGRVVTIGDAPMAHSRKARQSSAPIKQVNIQNRFTRPGPAKYAYEERLTVPVTTEEIEMVIYNLKSGEETPVSIVPINTALMAMEWSPKDRRLAVVRWIQIDSSRSGQSNQDSPEVQDPLGNLPPEDNPYFLNNALDLFHIKSDHVKHQEIRPDADAKSLFWDVDWDPHGMIFVAKMCTAGTPEGRANPVYTRPNGSTYRFYLFNGKKIGTLDRDEVRALYGLPHMISLSEVLIHAPNELDVGIYRYNLFTQKLVRLATPPGSVYQMAVSPKRKHIVYNFSSYQQPYELYRLKLRKKKPIQLTHSNDAARDLNKVRADQVRFTLSNGTERVGYLIQPADAAFPPDNMPLIVWQEGGPTATMAQEWGSSVERPFNILPNFGFAVLVLPLPGRDGFGPEFLDALVDDRNFGQIDIDEQVEIVEQMVDMGYTSLDRTGVTGCSYGGYFASQSVTRHSNAYAAANPQCSLLDLYHDWEMGYTNLIAYFMGRTPDDKEEYDLDSPMSRADLVDTPTLIFSGTEDFLPSDISRQFHDQINAAGTPADYYEFLGEGHGLAKQTSQFVAGQAQIKWFRDYLAKE